MPAGDTTRVTELTVLIDGNRYDLAPEDKAKEAGGRAWSLDVIASQEADPTKAAAIQIVSMHNGGGFTYQGLPYSYEYAEGGWDASMPGKWGSWPALAVTADAESDSYRGWQIELGGYLYVGRGRYVRKYAIDATFGAVWPLVEVHDLGDGIVVGGRPALWRGKLYWPRVTASSGAEAVFDQLTTVAENVTEVQTLTISGSPTSGTFTVGFDGKTTANIAFNATGADVQAALRLVPGLEAVTVVRSGSAPNFVHTVTMTAAPAATGTSSPPAFTSPDAFDTGGVTPATSTPGTSDRWDAGPATREARCFTVWKGLLVLGQVNEVRTCAGNPLTAGDWAPDTTFGYLFGDSGFNIVDLGIRQVELVAQKEEGPFTMNADLEGEMEIPDLERVADATNGIGMAYAQGSVINPHRAGLVRWNDESYAFIGPNQEMQLEGALSPGWGSAGGAATYGQYCFVVANDSLRGQGALWSMKPGGEARDPVWHCHDVVDGFIEDVQILSITEASPVPGAFPDTWANDNANGGTIDWSDEENAGAADDEEASALEGTTKLLKGTFGAGVPTSATIQGIVVEVKKRQAVAV